MNYLFAKFSFGDFGLGGKPGRGRRMWIDDQALGAAVEPKLDSTQSELRPGWVFTI